MNVSRISRTKNRVPSLKFPIRLNLGCGKSWKKIKPTYVGLDIVDYGQPIVWDMESGLPLPDDSCRDIFSSHVLEHLGDLIGVMNECWRVLMKGGIFHIVVPHKENEKALVPSHVRMFDRWSWDFFQYESYAEEYNSRLWEVKSMLTNDRRDMHVKMVPKLT